MTSFPTQDRFKLTTNFFLDVLAKGMAHVKTEGTDFYVVTQIGPAKDEANPGDDEEASIGFVLKGEGEDCAEEAKGDVEQVVTETNASSLFEFEFVVFETIEV